MIITNYERYGPKGNRYVGRSALGGYRWCIQHATKKHFDVAQGTCDGEDLPKDIREKCDAYDGVHYACQWPI